MDGTSASVQTTVLEVGDANCPNGGIKAEVLIDGVVEAVETQYVCRLENGPDACADNVAPMIEADLESALVYEAGKPYSLTVTANKAGLNYRFVAPYLQIEASGAEGELAGKYVAEYSVTPELGASTALIIATDGCEIALAEIAFSRIDAEEIAGIGIPAGSFNSSVPGASNPVSIGAFVMSKAPATVAQFAKCVEAGACTATNCVTNTKDPFCNYDRGDEWQDHPMNCVNWHGAAEFCEWIGGRLPTEDEWEYAATHDGTSARQTTYPWGDNAPTHCGHANYWDESEGSVGTSAVGTYSPLGDSPLGLQDMSGNVFEWTSSKHSNDMYTQAIKGISWNYSSVVLPVTHRSWHYLLYWNYVSGSAAFPPVSELLNSGFCLLNSSKAASAMGRLFCQKCLMPWSGVLLFLNRIFQFSVH